MLSTLMLNKTIKKTVTPPTHGLYVKEFENDEERRIFAQAIKGYSGKPINYADEANYVKNGIITDAIRERLKWNKIGMDAVLEYRKFTHEHGQRANGDLY